MLCAKLLCEEFLAFSRLSRRFVWRRLLAFRQHEGEFLQARSIVKRCDFVRPPRTQALRVTKAVSKFAQVDQSSSCPELHYEAAILSQCLLVIVIGHAGRFFRPVERKERCLFVEIE